MFTQKISISFFLLSLTLALFLVPSGVSNADDRSRVIITYKENVTEAEKGELNQGRHIEHLRRLRNGADVARVSREGRALLESSPRVLRVEDDAVAYSTRRSATPSQSIPWGITKVRAPESWTYTRGDGATVAVIDTGIDLTHSDLSSQIVGQYNAIRPGYSATDDNGHGTHVAGTIAAIDNRTGVIGVGPALDLYAVKVLDRNGSGWISDIIEGIDWAVDRNVDVINLSLGSDSNVTALHDAVIRAYNRGVTVVAAAGNNGGSVIYPAAYPEVIAVSAVDSSNRITSWSSRGSAVDIAAPGASIYSTYKGNSYATLSGTSMATPHVAGAAALLSTSPSDCDTNGDNTCSPAEIMTALKNSSTDLGTIGIDSLYGAGLLNIEKALLLKP